MNGPTAMWALRLQSPAHGAAPHGCRRSPHFPVDGLSAPEPRVPAGHPSPVAPRGQRMCPQSPPEGAADLQGRGGGVGAGASGGMGSRPLTAGPRGWGREKPLRGGGGRREPQSLGCRAQPPGSRGWWSPWGRREGAGGPSGLHAAGPGLQQAPCPRLACSRGRPSARLEGGAFRKSLCSAF